MNVKVIIGILGLVVFSGCTSVPQNASSGVVGKKEHFPIGTYAPNIPFTSVTGKATTFYSIRQPIAIVAFVGFSGGACCWLNPDLVTLAESFRDLPVSIVQVSLPTEKCSHGPGCIAKCNINDAHLVSLCDAEHIAWKKYSKPEMNTVFLIDKSGKIIDSEKLINIKPLAGQARELAEKIVQEEYDLYQG